MKIYHAPHHQSNLVLTPSQRYLLAQFDTFPLSNFQGLNWCNSIFSFGLCTTDATWFCVEWFCCAERQSHFYIVCWGGDNSVCIASGKNTLIWLPAIHLALHLLSQPYILLHQPLDSQSPFQHVSQILTLHPGHRFFDLTNLMYWKVVQYIFQEHPVSSHFGPEVQSLGHFCSDLAIPKAPDRWGTMLHGKHFQNPLAFCLGGFALKSFAICFRLHQPKEPSPLLCVWPLSIITVRLGSTSTIWTDDGTTMTKQRQQKEVGVWISPHPHLECPMVLLAATYYLLLRTCQGTY